MCTVHRILEINEKAENLRPANNTKTEGTDVVGVVRVRVQGKSIIGDNIVTSDDENENNDGKPIPKTEVANTAANAPKLDENQIQNLTLTSLKKIVATESAATASPPQKKPSVADSGTASKTIARPPPKFPTRVGMRNTGNTNRQPPTGNRNNNNNNGGNNRGSGNSLNRSFGGNSNNMLSDFGLNRNLSFGNDNGNNMGSNLSNSMGNNMGGNVGFGGNLRANSSFDSFDNNMMRGGLSNTSDFNSDFSSIGMRRNNMMGLGSNSNSMGSNGRGFDNNSRMGMSSSFSGNMWNSNSSNGGGGGGGGYNNSWGNGNFNRY